MLYSQYSTRTKLVDEDKLRTHEWLSNASLKAENDIFNYVCSIRKILVPLQQSHSYNSFSYFSLEMFHFI